MYYKTQVLQPSTHFFFVSFQHYRPLVSTVVRMYPSSTIHFRSAWNARDDDDLSTLSGSTATTLFRSQMRQQQQQHVELDQSNSKHIQNRLSNYLVLKREKRSFLNNNNVKKPVDDNDDVEIPFDEVTQNNYQNHESREKDRTDQEDDNSGEDEFCKQWEVQADGNLEPVMAGLPFLPVRQNKFEKSSKSAFVSPKDVRTKSIGVGGSSANARRDRRNRLERIRKRQGGKLVANSTRLSNSSIETSSCCPTRTSIDSPKQDFQCHEMSVPSISGIRVSTPTEKTENTKESKRSFDLVDEKEDFEKNLSMLKLKLNAAKTALGTQSEILSEVSKTCNSEHSNGINMENIADRTTQLKKSLPSLSSHPSPISVKKKESVTNFSHAVSASKQLSTSPGSSFTNSTRTTECTSTASPAKNEDYIDMIKDCTQKLNLNFPSPDSPCNEIERTCRQRLSFDDLLSPPGLRRRRDFSLMGDTLNQNGHADTEQDELASEGNMSLSLNNDIPQIKMTSDNKKCCRETEDITKTVSNEHHKVTLTIEMSGDSLHTLQALIKSLEQDVDKYRRKNESISVVTTSDCDLNSLKSDRSTCAKTSEAKDISNQSNRSMRILEASSESIVKEIRTAIQDATLS